MTENQIKEDGERVPLFSKWIYWYLLVIGVLLLLMVFFYLFTKQFS